MKQSKPLKPVVKPYSNQRPENWERTGWALLWTPRRGPQTNPCFESGIFCSTSAGFGHMFWKDGKLSSKHFGRERKFIILQPYAFLPNSVLEQGSGRLNISGLVQKISNDIVQLTVGFFTPCVVRWHFTILGILLFSRWACLSFIYLFICLRKNYVSRSLYARGLCVWIRWMISRLIFRIPDHLICVFRYSVVARAVCSCSHVSMWKWVVGRGKQSLQQRRNTLKIR